MKLTRVIIIVTLILAMAVGLAGCLTINPPAAPTPTPMPPVTPKATPPAVLELHTPHLVSPHNEAAGIESMPIFLWKEVPNARGYELTIAHNYDFSDVYYDVSTTLTGYKFTEGLEPSSRYYWMVAAKMNPADPDTPVAYSEVWTFTTAAPAPTPTPRSADRDKILRVPREYLAREGGFTINVPPADYVIIPISVGEYEHLAGWGWNAKGETEDYLDSWMTNDHGGIISESGRAFNYSCGYAFDDHPGLPEGTYYIYLSNEFTSASAKAVTLRVRWR